jgi:hypothetical protein
MRTWILSWAIAAPAFAQDAAPPPVKVSVYGTVVVNTVYNTGTVQPSQEAPFGAAMGSRVEGALQTDGSFTISPRQSRIGVDAERSLSSAWTAKAKMEFDFFGLHDNTGPLGTPHTGLRLRHAYFTAETGHVRLTAGQLMTVVTPRVPTSYGHMAIALHTMSGNVWNRLPQLTVDGHIPVGDAKVTGAFAIARPHTGHGAGIVQRFDATDPGTRGELPLFQAHTGFDSKLFTVGVGGQVGRETWDLVQGMDETPGVTYGETLYDEVNVATWLVSADWKLKTGPVWFMGQIWRGQNLNGMFGRQGVRLDEWEDVPKTDPRFGQTGTVTAMRASGGWLELGVTPVKDRLDVVASVAMDRGNPEAVDYNAVWLNDGVFGAVVLHPHEKVAVSLEFLRNVTKYRPNDEYRTDEDYDQNTDPFRGEPLPLRMREGYNESLSLNAVYSF